MNGVLLRAARVLAAVVAVLLLPAGYATVSATAAFAARYAPGPERAAPAAAPAPHDPAKPTAVVVVGARGAEVSDTLAPYQILAETGRFNVYTVAPQRGPIPLTGGLDLVPDLTFDDLAALAAPALVVVPALPDLGEPTTAPVTAWLRTQAERGTRLLSICNGAGVLASAGLADGLLVPGATAPTTAAIPGGPAPEYVHRDRPGFAFDATVTDLAAHTDRATARWAATVLELPTDGLPLDGAAWPWGATFVLVALAVPGAMLVVGILRRRPRSDAISTTSNHHQDPRPVTW